MTCLRRQPRAYLTCLPHTAHQTLRSLTAAHADLSACQRGAEHGNATRGVASAIATLAALLLTIAVLVAASSMLLAPVSTHWGAFWVWELGPEGAGVTAANG